MEYRKEALGLQEPVLFEGAKELLEEIQAHGGTPFFGISSGSSSFDPYY